MTLHRLDHVCTRITLTRARSRERARRAAGVEVIGLWLKQAQRVEAEFKTSRNLVLANLALQGYSWAHPRSGSASPGTKQRAMLRMVTC